MTKIKIKEHFVMPKIGYSFIENDMFEYPRLLELYIYLRRNVIREGWKDLSGVTVGRDFYENRNLLVAYKKLDIIIKEFKISKRKLLVLLDKLFELDWIEIEKYKLPNGKVMNIYILGEWYIDKFNRKIETYKGDVDYE